jgi:hypothetical protein
MEIHEPFDVFISYNHGSSLDFARHIYHTAIANGVRPWMDEGVLTPGNHFPTRAAEGIHLSKRYFLIATPKALASPAVLKEIDLALEKFNLDPTFQIMIYLHEDVDLTTYTKANLKEFIYLKDASGNPFPVMSQLIESITGKNMLVAFLNQSFSGAVAAGGAISNMQATEHLIPTLASLIMQIKTFLNNTAFGFKPEETLDSIRKLLAFTQLENVAMLQPGWITLGNGVFENLHPTRMRIPPRVAVSNLPSEIEWKLIFNDEVITRVQFLDKGTDQPHLRPFPFVIELGLDAEL